MHRIIINFVYLRDDDKETTSFTSVPDKGNSLVTEQLGTSHFIVLPPGDPHLLEGSAYAQYRSTNPSGEVSLHWLHRNYFHLTSQSPKIKMVGYTLDV